MLQLDGTGPLYQQIYRAFRNEILSGHLAPGERVPSTRVLTDLLKVSRNTAVLAYEQLLAEGYLETRVGASGTVVAPVLPADSIYSHSSELLDRQRGPLNRSNAKLNLGANTTAPALRFPARSGGVYRSAVCTVVQAARRTSPSFYAARSRLRPAGGSLGAPGGYCHSPPAAAWN
jgi:DNA-binding transcriptional MocR family regulator